MLKFTINVRNCMNEIQHQVMAGIHRITRVSLSAVVMILTAGVMAAAETGDSLRISDVIREVVAKNDRIAAARYMEKAAYDKASSAGAWDDPMLMVGVQNLPTSFDFSADPMTMKMIGLSQKIPYAGQKGLEKKSAKAEASAAREETKGTVVDLATAAKIAFIDVYYRRRELEYIKSQRDIQQDILASATARLRTDQARQADVAAAQADLWRLETDILSSEQNVEASQNDLLALMGRSPGSALAPLAEPRFDSLSAPVDEWLSLARDNYPPLRRLQRRSESYRYAASVARRMRWPMLELSGSYGLRSNPPADPLAMEPVMPRDNMLSFQAAISLPLFSARQQNKMSRSMENMGRSAEFEAGQMLRDINAQLTALHGKGERLLRSLDLYEQRIIPADEDAYRSAFAGYETNRESFTTLLMYALSIYRDRIASNQVAAELARTLAEAERFTTNPDDWNLDNPSLR
jgi:outer membrane protein TolC